MLSLRAHPAHPRPCCCHLAFEKGHNPQLLGEPRVRSDRRDKDLIFGVSGDLGGGCRAPFQGHKGAMQMCECFRAVLAKAQLGSRVVGGVRERERETGEGVQALVLGIKQRSCVRWVGSVCGGGRMGSFPPQTAAAVPLLLTHTGSLLKALSVPGAPRV